MASKSRLSFASRITNAERLYKSLQNFETYNPTKNDLKLENIQELILQLKSTHSDFISAEQAFINTADERKALFGNSLGSISKHVTYIIIYLRTICEKEDPIFKTINQQVKQMRETRSILITINSKDDTIERSEESYADRIQNFINVIDQIKLMGDKYNPENQRINLDNLSVLKEQALKLNKEVSMFWNVYKPAEINRNKVFNLSKLIFDSVKEYVKETFTKNSREYRAVKNISF